MALKSKPLKILLVDDQPIVIRAHCMMLEELGYTPDIAVTGEEAVIKAANSYDLILMDLDLPGISGIEATARIRHQEGAMKQAYIIAVTTHVTQEIEHRCQLAGINLIRLKPIFKTEMQALLLRIAA